MSRGGLNTLGTLQPAPAPGALGPEGVPVPAAVPLAGTATKATGQTVDGIGCNTSEQTLFHIHAHLTKPKTCPAGGFAPAHRGKRPGPLL